MSRKAFLGQVGALLLAVIGVSAILKSLGVQEKPTPSQESSPSQVPSGKYGSSEYGA
jgi:hypothetical protein